MDLLTLAAVCLLFGYIVARFTLAAIERRKNKMDDKVEFDDWERGSPDRDIPDNAIPVKIDDKPPRF